MRYLTLTKVRSSLPRDLLSLYWIKALKSVWMGEDVHWIIFLLNGFGGLSNTSTSIYKTYRRFRTLG